MTPTAAATPSLPALKYFMAVWSIGEEFGGMTSVSLYRAGMFERIAGVAAPVLTFDANPDYASRLRRLQAVGKIAPGTQVLNVFQHYREVDLEGRARIGGRWSVPRDEGRTGPTDVTLDAGGRPFSRRLHRRDGTTAARRVYYRADGSEFLRDEHPVDADGAPLGRYVTLLDKRGDVVAGWRSAWGFYRHWIKELAAGAPTAIIVDSKYTARFVAGLQAEHIVKLVVLHNSHVAAGGDPYHGPLARGQKPVHENVAAWDGVVFLTRKQRQDYEERFGSSTNLFTVSNPKPRVASPMPLTGRQPKRGVVVGRLDGQKNLFQAVRVMALVRKRLPDAVLDIYGTGPHERRLRRLIAALRLKKTVRLHGFVQGAAAEFDTARYSLLTSRNEGQPLVLMESLGRGCPPVSYDIRYGPSDVIEDGVNGFLVPAGDAAAAADRIVQICTDDDLAERLGRRAWESSSRFDDAAILEQWSEALTKAWTQRADRVRIAQLRLEQRELSLLGDGGVAIRGDVEWKQTAGPPLEAALLVNLVIDRRAAGRPAFLPADITATAPGKVSFSVDADAAALDREVPDEAAALDLFVQVQGNNVLQSFRVAFPGPEGGRLPYATAHGRLSSTALRAQPPGSWWRPFFSKRSRRA